MTSLLTAAPDVGTWGVIITAVVGLFGAFATGGVFFPRLRRAQTEKTAAEARKTDAEADGIEVKTVADIVPLFLNTLKSLEAANRDNRRLEERVSAQEGVVHSLQNRLNQVEQDLRASQAARTELITENDNLNGKLKTAYERTISLETEVGGLRDQVSALDGRVKELETENTRLREARRTDVAL